MKKGLTLIEVVISIALLGIVLVSALSIFDTGLFNIKRAGERTDIVVETKNQVDNLLSGGEGLLDTSKYNSNKTLINQEMIIDFGDGISHTFPPDSFTEFNIKNIDTGDKDISVEIYLIEETASGTE